MGIDLNKLSVAFRDRSLCTRSGTCVGICPENAISLDADYYPVLSESSCTECGRCGTVCPGGAVSFEKLNELTFGDGKAARDFDGRVDSVYVGHSTHTTMREGGAGGGVITGLLFDLLHYGDVDGCVVTRMRDDQPWLGEAFVARSEADLLKSQGSRYTIIPLNQIIRQIKSETGRFAVAALPCHIHGLRLAMAEDEILRSRIAAIIGLFCGGALETFVVPELLATKNIDRRAISDFQFRGGEWPGRMRAVMKDGEIRDLHYSNYKDGAYNYLIGLYLPIRCQTCIDGSSEYSDLSVSDAWTRDERGEYKFASRSRILVRTEVGRELLEKAIARGSLVAENMGNDKNYQTHRQQTKRKGINAPIRIERWRAKGIPVPQYDRSIDAVTAKERFAERLISGLLWLGRFRALRFPTIKFLTSKGAIPLIKMRLWLKKRKYQRG
jgi:coenzyme F420 hydrogenase subunit beta